MSYSTVYVVNNFGICSQINKIYKNCFSFNVFSINAQTYSSKSYLNWAR